MCMYVNASYSRILQHKYVCKCIMPRYQYACISTIHMYVYIYACMQCQYMVSMYIYMCTHRVLAVRGERPRHTHTYTCLYSYINTRTRARARSARSDRRHTYSRIHTYTSIYMQIHARTRKVLAIQRQRERKKNASLSLFL